MELDRDSAVEELALRCAADSSTGLRYMGPVINIDSRGNSEIFLCKLG